MRKYINTIILTLLLSSCDIKNTSSSSSSSNIYFNPYDYIKIIEKFSDLERKIKNEEDFIFVISSRNCSWCSKQFDEIFDNFTY